MRRKNMKCMQMQNARKFAYNASFDACVHNAARMKLNDVSCIVREFNGDAPPTTWCQMQCKLQWIFTFNHVNKCRRYTCHIMRKDACKCDILECVLMRCKWWFAFFSMRAKIMLAGCNWMWCVAECDAVVMSEDVVQCSMMLYNVAW